MVCEAMTKKPITVSLDTRLRKVAELMDHHHISSILIKESNKLKGIITEQDIVRKVIAQGINPLKEKAGNYMSNEITTVNPSYDIFDALLVMKEKNIRTLPVKDGNKLVGMLTLKDVLKIQPSLFDLWVEKIRIKEEETKPIFSKGEEGLCEACGEYSKKLFSMNDSLLCLVCKKEQS